MSKVFILQGTSGSGKSTFTSTLRRVRVCSADSYFMVDGEYRFDHRKLAAAHQACFRRFLTLAQDGQGDIVVDNTNMKRWEMYPYVMAANTFGHDVEIHTFLVDPVVAAERNTHGVPEATIRNMSSNLEMPLPFWGTHVVHSTEGWAR